MSTRENIRLIARAPFYLFFFVEGHLKALLMTLLMNPVFEKALLSILFYIQNH